MAKIIDGKAYAEGLRARIGKAVTALKAEHGLTPGLAVVLVGEDPASKVYVANKAKQTVEVGMNSWEHKLPADDLRSGSLWRWSISSIRSGGPRHPGATAAAEADRVGEGPRTPSIPPRMSTGFMSSTRAGSRPGQDSLVPCTPLGCVMLAKACARQLDGLEAVVIGRSNIVGKPVAQLLLAENCTVTIAHSRTRDLPGVVRRADLVIAAVGRPEMVKGDWLQAGRDRHRCRHQPHRARRQDAARRRLRLRQLRDGGRRDHPGAGRRRADDHRVFAAQHGARGMPAEGNCGSLNVRTVFAE